MSVKKTTHGNGGKQIDGVRHKDKRKNIPTEELRDFVRDDENAPAKVLYPRNPDLDPQLVWKGKDQQDAAPLAVPAVPIYIQEKIHPQAIIEDFKRNAPSPSKAGGRGEGAADQLSLFSDFNGLPADFADRVDFYHHEGNWSNRLILGDSLLVMTSLAEKEALKGRVQMIYIDPPYGINFGSNWQVSTRKREVKDGKAEDFCRQPEQVKAFRDTWELGIHSYLAYLRDRLVVARDLLTESGSIFVQIGDENVHLVRCLLDEVFGPDNLAGFITVKKTGGLGATELKRIADYVLWYCKDKSRYKYRPIYFAKEVGIGAGTGERYDQLELANGDRRSMTTAERNDPKAIPQGARPVKLDNLKSGAFRDNTTVPFTIWGRTYHPGPSNYWKTTVTGLTRMAGAQRIAVTGNSLSYVRFLDDFPVYELTNVWDDTGPASDKTYVVQTSSAIIERCVLLSTDPGDLVLDPTCGSGTNGVCCGAMGPAVDHHRHEPGGDDAGADAIDGRAVFVLLPGRRLSKGRATDRGR